jgi:hypothetical protein
MSRKITLGMGKRGANRGGNQITLGFGSSLPARIWREVLRLCSNIDLSLPITSEKFKWIRTS